MCCQQVMRFSLLIILTAILGHAYGQHSIYGKIIDARDSSSLPGATAYISDLKRGAVANPEGSYSIENLPRGNFLIEFKFTGYETKVMIVRVDGRTRHNVRLDPAVTELNEVVVTGISHSSELKRSPVPVATISSESLYEHAATNLVDNIAAHPGISQITTGAGISKPVVRGLSYNRVITLYDGIRQEGQQWGDEHGIEIDEFSVSRVEIIKGAGSLMYGSDGLGGIINFIAPNPLPEGALEGKWLTNFQSNNGLVGNSLSLAGNNKGIYWLGRISQKNARAYRNRYDGRVFNSGFNEVDLGGTIGIIDEWGFTQLNVSSFDQNVGLTEGERNNEGNFVREILVGPHIEEAKVTPDELSTYSLFVPKQSVRHFRVSGNTNYYRGNSRIQLDLGYQHNDRQEFGNVAAPDEPELEFDLHSFTYNLIYYLPPVSDLKISAGSSGMFQKSIGGGEDFLIPDYRFFDWGLFAFANWHYKSLDISGGVRYDQRSMSIDPLFLDDSGSPSGNPDDYVKFEGNSRRFGNYSASLGITQELTSSLTLKVNASRGFRAPSVAELSSNGRHEGSLQYEYGNASLEAETSFQLDAGLTLQSEHITLEAALFQNTIESYIYLKKLRGRDGLDSIPDPEDPVPAFQYIQGDARLVGGELTVDLHPHPFDWLHFENTLSGVRAVNRSEGTNDSTRFLPFIPALNYRGELRANVSKIGGSLVNAFFMIGFLHFWEQERVFLENGTETPTPAYSLWSSAMGASVRRKRDAGTLLTFYLVVNNILDTGYQDHLNRLKYAPENPATGRRGVFNMGRNVSVKVVFPFSFREAKHD